MRRAYGQGMTDPPSIQRSYALAEREDPALFAKVVCGLDSTPASREAARQAAILAGPGGRIMFVCAEPREGGRAEDDAALAAAVALAEDFGANPTAQVSDGTEPVGALLERVGAADLLVVGTHGSTRSKGILSGSVATTLLHRAESPVLIARRAPTARPFPRELLVASDGSQASHEAVRLARAIARRYHGDVSHLYAGTADAERRRVLSEESAALEEATGTAPVVLMEDGPAHKAIVIRARERQCSLVVVGSRGLGGLRALGSVSERVGHGAPCSVLVVRPPAGS
jgi:nucleotide-binding universal stress UspA family protein